MNFVPDINGPQRMNPTASGDFPQSTIRYTRSHLLFATGTVNSNRFGDFHLSVDEPTKNYLQVPSALY